jgi:hypothetical protein
LRFLNAAARKSPQGHGLGQSRAAVFFLLLGLLMGAALSGCHANQAHPPNALTDAGLARPTELPALQAVCRPPLNWKPDPLKQSATHTHEVWISPSGRTAYGVIYFHLPFPVGHELALWGFLNQMRASEGEATLLAKNWDANLDALRFVAEGGQYIVRTNLFVRGFSGWAVYAGTLRAYPVNQAELELAGRAREYTVVGPIH